MTLVLTLLALLAGWPTMTGQDAVTGRDGGAMPQVRPVLQWLSAVKSGNQDRLKTAFSAPMQRQFEQEGWPGVLRTYRDAFQKAFGDYVLEDFSFEFVGDADRGQVLVMHKGNKLPGVRVIRESTGWKVDER